MASNNFQQQADALGISPQDYAELISAYQTPGSGGGYTTSGSNAGSTISSDTATRNAISSAINTQKILNKAAGGSSGQQTQQQQPTQPTYSSVDQNPMYDLSRLGASALGQQEIVNATPGPADPKTGIGTVNQPQISKDKVTAPKGPWNNVPGLFQQATAVAPTAPRPIQPAAQPTAAATQTPTPFATVQQAPQMPQGMPQGMPPSMQGGPPQSFGDMVANHAISNEIARQTQAAKPPQVNAPGPQDRRG